MTEGQCPTCGRMKRDWTHEGAIRNEQGHKIGTEDVPDIREDRTAAYRKWRRSLPQAGATDFDQVEWRYRNKELEPVALLELTRVDGNVSLPPSYLQSILDRFEKRDWQGKLAKRAALQLGVKAWIVAFRHDLTDFWVYNLTDGRGWWTMTQGEYSAWLQRM